MKGKWYSFFVFWIIVLSFVGSYAQDAAQYDVDKLEVLHKETENYLEAFDYIKALSSGDQLIKNAEKLNNKFYQFLGYDLVQDVYERTLDYDNSIVYMHKGLDIAREMKSDSLIAWATNDLGVLYIKNNKNPQKGLNYLKESLRIELKIRNYGNALINYENLIDYYLKVNDLEAVKVYLGKLGSHQNTSYFTYTDKLYFNKFSALYNLRINKIDLAKQYAQKILDACKNKTFDELSYYEKVALVDAYSYMSRAYKALNNYKKAYEFNLSSAKYSKLIESEIKKKNLVNFKINYHNDYILKEQALVNKIKEKNQGLKTAFIVSSIVLFISIVILFLFFKTRTTYIEKLRKKNKAYLKAKQEAEQLSKIKSQFLSTVSHELRTPLYGVIGLSSILKNDIEDKTHKEDLDLLKFSADYLLSLINDVLLVNKIDSNSIVLKNSKFEIKGLINNIIKSFQYSLVQNHNDLQLSLDLDLPKYIKGDAIRISQILMNLIGNANKFNKNVDINVNVKCLEVYDKSYDIKFIIRDNGIGISKENQKSIFEEFTQVENYDNQIYQGGAGLGLSIVKRLLKLYNTEIELKSEIGKGAEFSFVLNLEKIDEDLNQTAISSQIDNKTTKKLNKSLKVLIVDDNIINQKITQKILSKHKIESCRVGSGEEAIKTIKRTYFDLILMDVNMPGISGIEATKRIREFNKNLPIIALTAVEMDEIEVKILNSGMNDMISKPYNEDRFIETILNNIN